MDKKKKKEKTILIKEKTAQLNVVTLTYTLHKSKHTYFNPNFTFFFSTMKSTIVPTFNVFKSRISWLRTWSNNGQSEFDLLPSISCSSVKLSFTSMASSLSASKAQKTKTKKKQEVQFSIPIDNFMLFNTYHHSTNLHHPNQMVADLQLLYQHWKNNWNYSVYIALVHMIMSMNGTQTFPYIKWPAREIEFLSVQNVLYSLNPVIWPDHRNFHRLFVAAFVQQMNYLRQL